MTTEGPSSQRREAPVTRGHRDRKRTKSTSARRFSRAWPLPDADVLPRAWLESGCFILRALLSTITADATRLRHLHPRPIRGATWAASVTAIESSARQMTAEVLR